MFRSIIMRSQLINEYICMYFIQLHTAITRKWSKI